MADYNPIGTTENVEPQAPAQELADLDDAYGRYQAALRTTFGYIQAGRLVDASRSLLEISEWLIGHARELGKGISIPFQLVSSLFILPLLQILKKSPSSSNLTSD